MLSQEKLENIKKAEQYIYYLLSKELPNIVNADKLDYSLLTTVSNKLQLIYITLSYYFMELKIEREHKKNSYVVNLRDSNPKIPEWEVKARVDGLLIDSTYDNLKIILSTISNIQDFVRSLIGQYFDQEIIQEEKENNIIKEEEV